jgi:putative transposase
MILIDEIFKRYLKQPYLGSRGMTSRLIKAGFRVNRKRIKRLMQKLGLKAVFSSKPKNNKNQPHKIYPYLLEGLKITKPNHVWCADITYIPMDKGFIYLAAVMDWSSRKILSWRISNTLDAEFCKEALLEAISRFGVPEIFNSDQGVQFTSNEFTDILKAHGIQISMDGKGRALDNIMIERFWRTLKYEEVYLNSYDTVKDAIFSIGKYIWDYNNCRPHSSFKNRTPNEVYENDFVLI